MRHWADLLEAHHDPNAPPWTASHPLTSQSLREFIGAVPVGEATRAGMTAPLPWAGLAHVLTVTAAVGRGELNRAEGVPSVLRQFSRDFPFIGGWRVALLAHVYARTDRVDQGIALYERVRPELERPKFATHRITFFLDASMARMAA